MIPVEPLVPLQLIEIQLWNHWVQSARPTCTPPQVSALQPLQAEEPQRPLGERISAAGTSGCAGSSSQPQHAPANHTSRSVFRETEVSVRDKEAEFPEEEK
ncbi:unnamed protein product [Pleuronectes platessa]|uniref:Uncharacterized protein n=1 Tax=Pleuronectes platessa TaxID=8262 RepID=A0A9N7TT85_PLEPL|nr:unnamed protein product [Pleuronectes platessa]